ncbi:hypothetical protein ACTWPT_03990 [Nonomuraea sp. 3N208]|uniref:hypothetical protein n=1 Tax=Nonomuraea sp. 3N208 TaxID=3457421 RepID=UPI003FCDCFA9
MGLFSRRKREEPPVVTSLSPEAAAVVQEIRQAVVEAWDRLRELPGELSQVATRARQVLAEARKLGRVHGEEGTILRRMTEKLERLTVVLTPA